jgi:hypothetical protein
MKEASNVGDGLNMSRQAHLGQMDISEFYYMFVKNRNIYQDQLVILLNKRRIFTFWGFYRRCLVKPSFDA